MNIIQWPCLNTINQNKYYKIYCNLISQSQTKPYPTNQYIEKHHIFPRSIFPDLANNPDNLVTLTPKEHYIAHRLLTKFTKGIAYRKMLYALDAMGMKNSTGTNKRYHVPSRVYMNNKIAIINEGVCDSTRQKISQSMKGKKLSEEHKQHLMIAAKKRPPVDKETCNKIRNSHLGRTWWNNGIVNIFQKEPPDASWFKGLVLKPRKNKTNKKHKRVTCVCGLELTKSNLSRHQIKCEMVSNDIKNELKSKIRPHKTISCELCGKILRPNNYKRHKIKCCQVFSEHPPQT